MPSKLKKGKGRRWRLAMCLSHPIQYKVPFLRRLAAHPEIELMAYFYSDTGLVEKPDSYHGTTARWDIPLLEGYRHEFLTNKWPSAVGSPYAVGRYLNTALLSRILGGNYDAVVIHSYTYPSDWLAWVAAKSQDTSVFFNGEMYPRTRTSYTRRLIRRTVASVMLKGCAACLAIGSIAVDVYRGYGIPDERIFLTPYAVNNDFFMNESARWRPRKAEMKAKLGIPGNLPVVLCVAGMVPKKRQADLVHAMARLDIAAQLILVGNGPLFERIQQLCQELLPSAILTGFVNQSQLPRYYAMADVFVLPSLWEEFGLVVNEAMCAGLPIIASDSVAASHDLVRSGENGFTFPCGDVDSLVQSLELILADRELGEHFGRRSLEIISNWDYDRAANGILDALKYASERGSGV